MPWWKKYYYSLIELSREVHMNWVVRRETGSTEGDRVVRREYGGRPGSTEGDRVVRRETG